MSEARKLIETVRESAVVALGIARSPYGPALLMSNRDSLERRAVREIRLCDTLESTLTENEELREEVERLRKIEQAAYYVDVWNRAKPGHPLKERRFKDALEKLAAANPTD